MRFPFLSLFMTSPLRGIQEHVEKVKECAWAFQQAVECYVSDKCESFEAHKEEVVGIESEADTIKNRIRGEVTKRMILTVNKFQLFMYLGEQDKVLDAIEDTLEWLSHRTDPGIPKSLEKEFFLLVDLVIEPIEVLSEIVIGAKRYFKKKSEKQRTLVKELISNLRQKEHEADKAEELLKHKIFSLDTDPVTVYHLIRLAEMTGSIADHAENAGNMMQAMVSR
jgi:predicted phosphate transport protein (TIGR00153 family)